MHIQKVFELLTLIRLVASGKFFKDLIPVLFIANNSRLVNSSKNFLSSADNSMVVVFKFSSIEWLVGELKVSPCIPINWKIINNISFGMLLKNKKYFGLICFLFLSSSIVVFLSKYERNKNVLILFLILIGNIQCVFKFHSILE